MQAWGVACGAAGLVLLPVLVFVLDEGPPASHLLLRAFSSSWLSRSVPLGLELLPETVAFLSC